MAKKTTAPKPMLKSKRKPESRTWHCPNCKLNNPIDGDPCVKCGLFHFSDEMPATPNFLAVSRGVCELNWLAEQGKDDSPEADAVRDATDAPWQALSEDERERIREFSEAIQRKDTDGCHVRPLDG